MQKDVCNKISIFISEIRMLGCKKKIYHILMVLTWPEVWNNFQTCTFIITITVTFSEKRTYVTKSRFFSSEIRMLGCKKKINHIFMVLTWPEVWNNFQTCTYVITITVTFSGKRTYVTKFRSLFQKFVCWDVKRKFIIFLWYSRDRQCEISFKHVRML